MSLVRMIYSGACSHMNHNIDPAEKRGTASTWKSMLSNALGIAVAEGNTSTEGVAQAILSEIGRAHALVAAPIRYLCYSQLR